MERDLQLAFSRCLRYKVARILVQIAQQMSVNKFFFVQGWILTNSGMFLLPRMDESLEHLITSCHYSKNFWAEVIKWVDKQGIKISSLSDKDIMFGMVRCNDELLAKLYIYYCRQKSSLPSIRVFDSKIKMIYQLEL